MNKNANVASIANMQKKHPQSSTTQKSDKISKNTRKVQQSPNLAEKCQNKTQVINKNTANP